MSGKARKSSRRKERPGVPQARCCIKKGRSAWRRGSRIPGDPSFLPSLASLQYRNAVTLTIVSETQAPCILRCPGEATTATSSGARSVCLCFFEQSFEQWPYAHDNIQSKLPIHPGAWAQFDTEDWPFWEKYPYKEPHQHQAQLTDSKATICPRPQGGQN